MKKSDLSIYKICIGNFERTVMWEKCQPKYSLIYKELGESQQVFQEFNIQRFENEIPICACKLDSNSWSLITTQRLITSKLGTISQINLETASVEDYGNANNLEEPYTLGTLAPPEEFSIHQFFIECGYCSQIMISAVHERIVLQKNSEEDNQRKIQMLIRKGIIKKD